MSNATAPAVGRSHAPSSVPRPGSAEISVDVRCGRCRSFLPTTVKVIHQVEKRRDRHELRRRFEAPGSCTCKQCGHTFRLHLLETAGGQFQLVAGVKIG